MAYDTDYGTCKFCGAKKVMNPKTQKIFCSEKCWLKKDPIPNGYAPQAPSLPETPQSNTQIARMIELLESIDSKLEEIRYNSLKDETGKPIPF